MQPDMSRAFPLMIQGTMSGVGKSLIVAGLCRLFYQDGCRVAPFKSQNMALNSFVTDEGLEMGRAQVMQAEAAGKIPSVLMNPVLLKPTSDTGSQVIVNGEVLATMSAREYFAYKEKLVPQILRSYSHLAQENDIIVLEGAGSPAEINLKQHDIVNMGMADMVDAPVLLVGDIDRGGVFAQLVGTVELLEETERRRVRGFIINKFRGDESLLVPGIEMLEARTGIPVLGTVPYLPLNLDDEDSLSQRFDNESAPKDAGVLDIAVVLLPHIANFSDFTLLSSLPRVRLRYVRHTRMLGKPDLLILPGTKNTVADLRWLKDCGMAAAIRDRPAEGVPLIGICGGYQMLGEHIEDGEGVEEGGSVEGLGLLPVRTVFRSRKTRTRVHGSFAELTGVLAPLSGMAVEGYEIHQGQTEQAVENAAVTVLCADGREELTADGSCRGNVYGTYLHGIFDTVETSWRLVHILAERRGLSLPDAPLPSFAQSKEAQYDALASCLRVHLDMEKVYALVGGRHG